MELTLRFPDDPSDEVEHPCETTWKTLCIVLDKASHSQAVAAVITLKNIHDTLPVSPHHGSS